jgi:hypothetical protein
MNLKRTLAAFVSAITEEAGKNEAFRANLEHALGIDSVATGGRQAQATARPARKGGRRTPAVLDPVELARQGEDALRERISTLDLEQLRDIVAQYGMDPGKLVMKWKDTNRVRDRIVELALARATKGDAFRGE